MQDTLISLAYIITTCDLIIMYVLVKCARVESLSHVAMTSDFCSQLTLAPRVVFPLEECRVNFPGLARL